MSEQTAIAKTPPQESVLKSVGNFKEWLEVSNTLSKSTIIPKSYQNNPSNCLVALEISGRIGISPMMVMQNLDIIQGKPSWSGAFIIAAINSCGRFDPLRFQWEGEQKTDSYGCRAVTSDKHTGEPVQGSLITWKMVKGEGWLNKSGSKWQTMPEQMFQYRAASFFGRIHCPDILFGMHSVEEIIDVVAKDVKEFDIEILQTLYMEIEEFIPEDRKTGIERILKDKEEKSYQKVFNYLNDIKTKVEQQNENTDESQNYKDGQFHFEPNE